MDSPLLSEQLTDEMRAAHRDLSEVDLRFREHASREPQLLSQAGFRVPDMARGMLGNSLQPWPVFLDRRKRDELARVSVGLSYLIKSVPGRLFGGDPAAVARFYGLDSAAEAESLLSPPDGIPEMLGRGDLIHTADGFQCIEFNFFSRLGGWESTILAPIYLSSPPVARFLRQEGVRPAMTLTTRVLFRHIVAEVERRGLAAGEGPNIVIAYHPALARHPDIVQGTTHLGNELQQVLGEMGRPTRGRFVVATWDELQPAVPGSGPGLTCRGLRVHAVIEQTTEPIPEKVYRAFKDGGICLFNSPVTTLLTSKLNIALLSEHQHSGLFSAEESELIRRHIPWSRLAVPGEVELRGERVSLPELLAARREDLVLKEALNLGGKGVAVGRITPADRWEEICRSALASGGWIVQEHVESTPYLYQSGDYGCSPHDVVWGPFVFGSHYAGLYLRMKPKSVPGVVNCSQGANAGVAFEV